MKHIEVIVPVYNTRIDFLEELKQSLLFAEAHICYIDDASSEKSTVEWVKKQQNCRKIFHSQNKGTAAAMNTGISTSKAPFLVTMGSDDTIMPNYLNKCLEIFSCFSEVDVIAPQVEIFGDSTGVLIPEEKYTRLPWQALRNMIPASSCFKKSLWQSLGGFDENPNLYEDWDFWFRASHSKAHFKILDQAGYRYRVHSKNRSEHLPYHRTRFKMWQRWATMALGLKQKP